MADHLEQAGEYTERLREVYGEDLVSVGLYGSAARGDFRPGSSDLNLLVILRQVDAQRLRSGGELARKWVEAGNPPPLLFSESEWEGSADVFPIEYSDIADAHLVLHGSDPFADVEVRWEHLRQMCEHQLKVGKISLRERYMLASGAPEEIGALLTGSISSFVALFRAMLRLAGIRPSGNPGEVVTATAELAGFGAAPFHRALEARGEGATFAPSAADPVVEGYLAGVARCSEWLDTLPRPADADPAA
jgi:predicted nucleotidyltransferase